MRTVPSVPRSLPSVLLLCSIAVATGPVAGQAVTGPRLFSGVASAGGANGTQWRSEVVLSNVRSAPSEARLEIVPRNGTGVVASLTLPLAAGETRRLPDLYAAMDAPSGAGTLRVSGEVLAWVRTYNQGASGTFGMDVPSVTAREGWAAGTPVLFPIQTPSNAAREFRSNLLVTNLESSRTTLTLAAGGAIRTFDVEPGTFAQIDGVGGWLGAPNGASMLTVVSTGRWFGLVTSIDPVLGDPTGMRGLTGEARATTVFPGVASASGMNGTLWRSEARLFNPGLAPRTVGLEILPRGGATVAASTSLTLAPLELRSLDDVYAAVGAPSGAGTLRVTGDVRTWVRTFNRGPQATFGTDVPEVVPGVAYGSGARVSFPVHTAANVSTGFRSNLLVYNHEARSISLSVKAAGLVKSLAVPAGAFLQQDNLGAFLGLAPGTATASASANGRWSAIVTAIDPYLGDPTTVLGLLTTANPVPTGPGVAAGELVSATIGPAGGTLASPDGRLALAIPAGALSTSTLFTLQPFTNLAWGGLGSAYELTPAEVPFAVPARLTFRLTAEDTESVGLGAVGVGQQDQDGYWYWAPDATRDAAARTVSVPLSRLGPVVSASSAPAGPEPREGLATVFRYRVTPVGDLWLQPQGTTPVQEGKTQEFWVDECYPPAADDGAARRTVFRLPASGGCRPYRQAARLDPEWSVDGVRGGNGTVGTIESVGEADALYTAPGKAPSPDTVAVSAFIGNTLDLSNVTLVSHVKVVGSEYRGTFTLAVSNLAQMKFNVRGEAVLEQLASDANGVSYDLKGTVTVDPSFQWMGMSCACGESATKPIPQDAVFAVQRKPTLGQRWVMPGVSWSFVCNPGGSVVPVAVQYFVAPPGDCSAQSWVPLADENRLQGSFTSNCNPAFTVNGSWDFRRD